MAAKLTFDTPIAHRGLHDRARGIIENSASAFEAAIAGGFPIECDVQLSRDGIPFVFHDDVLDRLTTETGPVSGRTAAELTALQLRDSAAGDRPQLFTEFLAQIDGRILLQIELKQQHGHSATQVLAQKVVDALKSYRGPVVLESFDPQLLMELRKRGATAPLGIIIHGYKNPDWDRNLTHAQRFALRNLVHWPLTRFEFISCHDQALDLTSVRLFRSFGIPVTAWTVRSPSTALATVGKADQIVFEGFVPKIA
ncbi:glycerophosphodiester phosphodiesterase family protein [Devosia sp.]|uniref:glycerophosphodiester phosphodiesterase family protein n=1 Tax=Devosia sp. TaxID=1871048 RepID=UPI003A8DFB03